MSTTTLLVWGRASGIGGTESRMAEVIDHWRSQGRRTISVMLAPTKDTPLRRLLESNGSVVIQAGGYKLARVLWHERPRLVMAFGLRASLSLRVLRLVAWPARRRWPHTVDARNGLEVGRSRLLAVLDRASQRLVDTFVTNSDAAARGLVRRGFGRHRIRVLYSALGERWQSAGPRQGREGTSIVMVGNARPEKQHGVGLELFSRLPLKATLTVFTDDATDLRRRWAELATTALGEVRFCEGRSVRPEDLSRTAIMLHPSSSESAPRCLMEGRACGCHVVAFDVGDTRRIVAGGGTVVPVGDDDALFHALVGAVRSSVSNDLSHTPAHYPSVGQYAADLLAVGGQR